MSSYFENREIVNCRECGRRHEVSDCNTRLTCLCGEIAYRGYGRTRGYQ